MDALRRLARTLPVGDRPQKDAIDEMDEVALEALLQGYIARVSTKIKPKDVCVGCKGLQQKLKKSDMDRKDVQRENAAYRFELAETREAFKKASDKHKELQAKSSSLNQELKAELVRLKDQYRVLKLVSTGLKVENLEVPTKELDISDMVVRDAEKENSVAGGETKERVKRLRAWMMEKVMKERQEEINIDTAEDDKAVAVEDIGKVSTERQYLSGIEEGTVLRELKRKTSDENVDLYPKKLRS